MNNLLLLVLVFAISAALAFSFPSADAIVPASLASQGPHSDYPDSLLVAIFTVACSALLGTLVMHYYRVQWGRRSVLTR